MARSTHLLGVAATLALLCSTVVAQQLTTTDFVFANPGARSIGFGGAFVSLADDATAAFANPSGLVQIVRPEISAELKLSNAAHDHDSAAELTGLAFVSYVYPGRGWSLAAYTHQLASFEVVSADDNGGTIGVSRQLTVVNLAIAGAYRLSEHLSVGLNLSYFDGELDTGSLLLPDSLDPDQPTAVRGDWGVGLGLLWRLAGPWQVGGFYRQGADLELATPEGASTPIAFPDVFGMGASFRPGEGQLTIAVEWDRIRYASLLDSLETDLDNGSAFHDGDELHIGAEYAVLRWNPVAAFRCGLWFDPGEPLDLSVAGQRDDLHLTAGFGLAWRSFQIDLGLDLAEQVDTVSVSAIFSF